MHTAELTARMKFLQQTQNTNDSARILEQYNRAFIDGFQDWFASGMQGSAMKRITDIMHKRGVMP